VDKMNAFWLKIIAIVAMALNHTAHVFGSCMPDPVYYVCLGVGGLTFPIMAYLMTEGYQHTRDVKRYAGRLLLFAVIAFVPYVFAFGGLLNVLFTLFLGLVIIYLYDTMQERVFFWVIFVLVVIGTIFCDWGIMGVPMMLCYYVIKNRIRRVVVPVLIVWGIMSLNLMSALFVPGAMETREIIANAIYAFGGCTATIPLLLSYNGERGRPMKYFFYAFYPGHLMILVLLKYLV